MNTLIKNATFVAAFIVFLPVMAAGAAWALAADAFAYGAEFIDTWFDE